MFILKQSVEVDTKYIKLVIVCITISEYTKNMETDYFVRKEGETELKLLASHVRLTFIPRTICYSTALQSTMIFGAGLSLL